MRVPILDAHDRLTHLKKQTFSIAECCQDMIEKRPFGSHPFYIFAHPRTDDDGVTKRLIWQPRLTKPRPQSNSMLFKAYPGQDIIKVIWMIPAAEMWEQYKKGNVTESQLVAESIHKYINYPEELAAKEEDDLSDEKINEIYKDISVTCKPRTFVV